MTSDVSRRRRTLRKYQMMFHLALAGTSISGGVAAAGIGVALFTFGIPTFLPISMIAFLVGALLMYRLAVSTMHLLEQDSSRNWFSGQ